MYSAADEQQATSRHGARRMGNSRRCWFLLRAFAHSQVAWLLVWGVVDACMMEAGAELWFCSVSGRHLKKSNGKADVSKLRFGKGREEGILRGHNYTHPHSLPSTTRTERYSRLEYLRSLRGIPHRDFLSRCRMHVSLTTVLLCSNQSRLNQ